MEKGKEEDGAKIARRPVRQTMMARRRRRSALSVMIQGTLRISVPR